MFTPIIAVITKLPSWLKTAMVMGVVLLAFEVKHRFETKKLNDQLVTLSNQLKTEQLNNARMQIGIEQQNAAIAQVSAQSKRIAADAATRALRVLKAQQATSAELKSPQTTVKPGADAMNEWMRSKFPEAK